MIISRRLAAVAAAALTITGLTASGAAASTAHGLPSRVQHIGAATVTIHGNWKRANVTIPRTHLPRPKRAGSFTSTNWGGYADVAKSGVALRYASANYNVPNLNCANSGAGTSGLSYYASWTGLDGWSDNTVEQQGTEQACDAGSPGPLWVFYEMFPADPVVFTGAVTGDAIQSSTFYNASTGEYSLAVTDLTQNGAGISVSIKCAGTCHNNSAEVISEAPGGRPPAFDLADFGAQAFTNAAVTSRSGVKGNLAGNSLWTGNSIRLVGQSTGDTLMTTGPLQGNTAFWDQWRASS
jgi:Peptidase A4 family